MNRKTLIESTCIIVFAVAISSFLIWLGSGIDSPDEPYTVLKTKYHENYRECVRTLPRDKDCIIEDVTFKIINIEE